MRNHEPDTFWDRICIIDASTGKWYATWAITRTKLVVEIEGAMEIDSDGDGVSDSEDGKPSRVNEPINYILYYPDEGITGLKGPYEEYCDYFLTNRMNCESILINSSEDFVSAWNLMTKDDNGKVIYSHIENLIVLFHGALAPVWCLPNGELELSTVRNLVDILDVYIRNVDLQMCHSGVSWDLAYNGEDYWDESFAVTFAQSEHIDYVYSSSETVSFNCFNNFNFTPNYKIPYIVFENDTKFCLYCERDEEIVVHELSHIMHIMERYYPNE